MKRFRFSLQPLAIVRAHRESRAREIFAAAVNAFVAAEQQLESVRQRVAEFESALFAGRAGSFNAAVEAHRLSGYRREVAAEQEAERAVAAARDLMLRRRNEYLEAHRQLEVVRRLETKARLVHRTATLREEQAEYDEFSTRKAARRVHPVSL